MKNIRIHAVGNLAEIVLHKQRIEKLAELRNKIAAIDFDGNVIAQYTVVAARGEAKINIKATEEEACKVKDWLLAQGIALKRACIQPQDMYCHDARSIIYGAMDITLRFWSNE